MTNSTIQANNKIALIIGCNGTFGGAVGQQLLQQGWQVKALLRNEKKCPQWLNPASVVVGNCESIDDVKNAAGGVDVIVYAANPLYHQWQKKALKMLEPTVQVAERFGLHILFPGNVYGFDPQKTPLVSESSQENPVNDKGEIRLVMEQRLKRACDKGATVTLIRAGDFIAKNADSSSIDQLLSKKKNGWSLANPSPISHYHCYAWMPDLAANAVALLDVDKQGYNVWNEQGIYASHQDWINAIQSLNLHVTSKTLPWWALKVVGVFHPIVREVVKMRYLWQYSMALDGSKMQAALGAKYCTSSLKDIARALTN